MLNHDNMDEELEKLLLEELSDNDNDEGLDDDFGESLQFLLENPYHDVFKRWRLDQEYKDQLKIKSLKGLVDEIKKYNNKNPYSKNVKENDNNKLTKELKIEVYTKYWSSVCIDILICEYGLHKQTILDIAFSDINDF